MITTKDIENRINKANHENITVLNPKRDHGKYKYIFCINTEWLNEVNDAISVYLVQHIGSKQWILTDWGSTHFECSATGLFDTKDKYVRAWQKRSHDIRTYFIHAQIKQDKQHTLSLTFSKLSQLDDRLHQFLQMMIELLGNAELIQTLRSLDNDQKRASQQ